MEGWNRKCGCGCSTPGNPCRGFTPLPSGFGVCRLPSTPPYVTPPNYTPHRHDSSYGWIPPSHCMGTFRWQTCYGGSIPQDAVHAGTDLNGSPIYAGRAFHCGDLLPAKVTPAHGCAFISYGGNEISKQDYEVLCSNHVAWKFCQGGSVPPEAIRIGNTSDGEHLFMGRTMVEGTLTPGKVHPSHGCLYVPFDGRELSFPTYEVLVLS
ncbi:natterin-3-like isoform X2 [Rhodnius prolixus]|uniref:Putative two dm9 repeat protein n=1 Tax=Rhodnius prolixus TaxID=13249 RepID=R4FL58_RHOPR